MIKVGLTGGIGSGKTTISNMFKELGYPVIDADEIARDVLKMHPNIIKKIGEDFGWQFIDDNFCLKRKEFGSYIFKHFTERKRYEMLIIPYIKESIFNEFKKYEEEGYSIVVLDAPTLIENGLHEAMDFNILVYVDKKTQIKRVVIRDGLSEEEIINRINAQMSLDEKKDKVNFILDNSKGLVEAEEQFRNIEKIIGMYK